MASPQSLARGITQLISRSHLRHFATSSATGSAAAAAQRFDHGHLPNSPNSPYVHVIDEAFFSEVRANYPSAETTQAQQHSPETVRKSGIPTFRLMDGVGRLLDGVSEESLNLTKEEARKMYETMLFLPAFDLILSNAQRQGRISFMMTSAGEEAAVIGSAAGLGPNDEVFSQYRESGVLFWRGCTLDQMMAQVFGTEDDVGGGRQMPIHFGSPEHKFHTVSSPLATQIPQAAGAAYALKRTRGRENDIVACYFGEGAASEGDFHAGVNMASTLDCPILFIVRNNGFAISTPATEQYKGDGIASRGPGYGMDTLRVDGNDVFAVRAAVAGAKQRILSNSRPILLDDDSSAYRSKDRVEDWKRLDNPLHRMRNFLHERSWWSDEEEEAIKKQHRADLLRAINRAEKRMKPSITSMFEDVYQGQMPQSLQDQRAELARLIKKYGQHEPWAKEIAKHRQQGADLEAFLPKDQ
ncbi:hypothetical protein OC846_003448 [Tilletia horrida]|uniref:2-oxoisovalerate dehydrogenase subunit alpha n=1 Tax=Tilletia horrida TaxID=155126 RepID=A0AAN6GRX2_9BASI|nr:hypothetical protein OC846_003448 [Tilletia horrida]KAK0566032.1 hypothetical protein OC861_003467 [Tilletia horrida]